ncbi:MAG: GNAT family N-acetyltransferase [Chlorobiota bacterium]|nr:MAG: GNAT family N-acetyltransferase [Chlorobiota bacterium]
MASSNDSADRFVIRAPSSPREWEGYYALRYRILRQPWNQPPGSERDELEPIACHRVAIEHSTGRIVGCGRIHRRDDGAAQIRYMAVEDGYRNLGIGALLLESLEQWALEQGIGTIVLYARTPAVAFYKQHGYRIVASAHTLFGAIEHVLMQKP